MSGIAGAGAGAGAGAAASRVDQNTAPAPAPYQAFGIVGLSHTSALVGRPNLVSLRISGAPVGSTVYVVFLSKFLFEDESGAPQNDPDKPALVHKYGFTPVSHCHLAGLTCCARPHGGGTAMLSPPRVIVGAEVERGGTIAVWTPVAVKPGPAEVRLSKHPDGLRQTLELTAFNFVTSIVYSVHPHRIPAGSKVRVPSSRAALKGSAYGEACVCGLRSSQTTVTLYCGGISREDDPVVRFHNKYESHETPAEFAVELADAQTGHLALAQLKVCRATVPNPSLAVC